MHIRLITAAVLALAGAATQAATRYDFSYTGLHYEETWSDDRDGFHPEAAITGFFVGTDTSGDGTLQLGELTDFAFSYNYGIGSGGLEHLIGPNVSEYCFGCALNSFSYTPGGTLTFDGVLSGFQLEQRISNTELWSQWFTESWTLTVTPATVIRVAEVPEPGGGAMLLAGLAGLACLGRRRAATARTGACAPPG